MDDEKVKLLLQQALGSGDEEVVEEPTAAEESPELALIKQLYGITDDMTQPIQDYSQTVQKGGKNAYRNFQEILTNVGNILSQKGPLTQAFGNFNPAIEKFSGGVNYGTDIGVPTGTKAALPNGQWLIVKADAGGGMNSGYGNSVMAQNLETGEKLRLSHLSEVRVKQGEVVGGGQVVGLTGETGNATGPHLDLEYRDENGQLSDVMSSKYGGNI